MHSGNEVGFDYPAEGDGELGGDDLKTVTYACGHPGLADRMEADPGPGDVCWGCKPCPCCGERWLDCFCGPADPFAELETEADAQARMSPEDLAADRAYLEGRR